MSTDQQWDIATGVGLTALAVAAGRAAESARSDALMTDPYAARLVEAAPTSAPIPASPATEGPDADELWVATSTYVGLRSRVFDDYFLQAFRDGVTQAVILASGLDTRPYRLAWPSGAVCFELDQPAVLEFKASVLNEEGATAGCEHHPLPVDLRDDWGAALREAGLDTSRPTAWLAEGLLPYLPPEAETRLFEELTRLSAPGSRFAVERIDHVSHLASDPVFNDRAGEFGLDVASLFPDGEREPAGERLTQLGWKLTDRSIPETAAAYSRTLPSVQALSDHITHTFGELV